MKLTFIEKMKIGKMLRESSLSDINYSSFYNASNNKTKYSDLDILDYLVNFAYEELSKKEVINLHYLLKYIYSIKIFLTNIINYEKVDLISENTKNKLAILEVKYEEIKNNYPEEINRELDSEFEQLKVLLEGIKIEIAPDDADEALEKENKENQHAEEVKKLEAEKKYLQVQNEELQKRIKKDTENNTIQSQIININNQKIRLLESQLKELGQNYAELNNEHINLKESYKKLSNENDNQSSKITSLEETINSQQERLVVYEMNDKLTEVALKAQEKIEFLANVIFKIIRHKQMSALEILEECNKKGFDTNIEEVKKALIYLESKVKITSNKKITIPKQYKVESVKPKTNLELALKPKKNGYLDILAISDLHAKKVDIALCQEINKVYDYCAKSGINLILDLGDFLGITHPMSELNEYDSLLDDFVKNLPVDDNIIHAILGGNHDENASIGGYSTLEKLCELKEGLLFLGQNRANVVFDVENKNHFAIHHINQKIETDFINLFPESNDYVNLIGHTHISKFDLLNNNIFVPSLTKDRMCNGALKVRIYFDKENNIDYMLFTLLKNEELGLIPVTEIPYKRILKTNCK